MAPLPCRVTWVSPEIRNMEIGTITFRTAEVTNLAVTHHNIEDIVAYGRARSRPLPVQRVNPES